METIFNRFLRRLLLSTVFFASCLAGFAQTSYYLKTGATDISLATSWTTSSTGVGGSSPANLTATNCYYYTYNSTDASFNLTMSTNWAMPGTTRFYVGNGTAPCTLTVPLGRSLTAIKLATIAANASMVVDGTATTSGGNFDITVTGALTVSSTGSFTLGNTNRMPITGMVTIAGAFTNSSTFAGVAIPNTGTITIASSGTFTNSTTYAAGNSITNNAAGNMTINGTFTHGGTSGFANAGTITVNGTLTNSSTYATSLTNTGAGTMAFNVGSFYNHAKNGDAIPTATWNATSTCNVTGVTNTLPTGLGQTFGHFIWDCTLSADLVFTSMTTNGDFYIKKTGASNRVELQNGSTLSVGGDLKIGDASTATTFRFCSTNASTTTNLYGNFTLNNATLDTRGNSNNNINFLKANGTQYYSSTNTTFDNENYNISVPNSGTTLDVGTSTFGTTSGTFTLGSGATLATAHASGVNGNLTMSGTKTLNTASSFIFNGAVDQVTGALMPATIAGLTMNQSVAGAKVTLTQATTVNSSLTLTQGDLNIGNISLTIPSTATVGNGNVNSMVVTDGTGQLLRSFAASGASTVLYPVGDGTYYYPITLGFTALTIGGTSPRTVGVIASSVVHPSMNTGNTPSSYLNRYWSFTTSNITSYTYGVATNAEYPSGIVTGSEADLQFQRWSGSAWSGLTSTAAANKLTLGASYTSVAEPLTGSSLTGRCFTPSIVLASPNPAVPAFTRNVGYPNHNVYRFTNAVSNAKAVLSGLTFSTTGTYVASDISRFVLKYSPDGGTTVNEVTSFVPTGTGVQTFPAFTQAINNGVTGTFWIAVDIATNAVHNHTLTVSALATSNLGYTNGVLSNTGTYDGGTLTINDNVAPTVSSIVRAGTSPTSSTTLDYTVTFSEAVTGVATTNFGTTTTGTIAGAVVTSVTSVSTSVYTVRVTFTSGDGTVRLNLSSIGTIKDLGTNALAATFNSGEVYTLDRTAPTLTTVLMTSNNGINAAYARVGDVVTITVTSNEALDPAQVSATISGLPATITGSGTSWTITRTMDGTETAGALNFAINYKDLVGNSGITVSTLTSGSAIIFDGIAPTVSTYGLVTTTTSDLVLTMNENIVLGNTPLNITIYNNTTGTGVWLETITNNSAQVTISGNTITINPASTFAASGYYYVLIDNLAFRDVAGNYYGGISDPTKYAFDFAKRYKTIASGNWTNTAIWQTSSNGGGTWVAATAAPAQADGPILISAGHNVTFNYAAGPTTEDEVTVEGTLTIPSGTGYRIGAGIGTDLVVSSTGLILNNGTLSRAASTSTSISGKYTHNQSAGNIPALVWNSGSVCELAGADNSATTGVNQAFQSFTYNSAGTLSIDPLAAAYTGFAIAEDLNVLAGTFSIITNPLTIGRNVNINTTVSFPTAITLTGTNASIGGTGTITFSSLVVNGTYTNNCTTSGKPLTINALSGTGKLTQASGAYLTLGGTIATTFNLDASTNCPNTVTYSGGNQVVRLGTYCNLILTAPNSGGTYTKDLTGSATGTGTLTINGDFTITTPLSTAYNNCKDNGNQIIGNATGKFKIDASAALWIGTSTAIATTFPTNFVTGNITLDAASTVLYNATVNQNVSSVPAAYGKLGVTYAVKTLDGNIVVDGDFTINTSTPWTTFNCAGKDVVLNAGTINNGAFTLGGNNKITYGGSYSSTYNTLMIPGTLDAGGASYTSTPYYDLTMAGITTANRIVPSVTGGLIVSNIYTQTGGRLSQTSDMQINTGFVGTGGSIYVDAKLTIVSGCNFSNTATMLRSSSTTVGELVYNTNSDLYVGHNQDAYTPFIANVTLNNTSGITLVSPLAVGTKLELKAGTVLTTDDFNYPSIPGLSTALVNNTTAGSYTSIDGPIGIYYTAGLAGVAANDVVFQHCEMSGGVYVPYQFTLQNVSTSAAAYLKITPFTSGATYGDVTVLDVLPRNWRVEQIVDGLVSATVRIQDDNIISPNYRAVVALSPAQAGAYTSIGNSASAAPSGTPSVGYVASDAGAFLGTYLDGNTAYFAICKKLTRKYYSYQTGNWNGTDIWTTDASGTTLIGSATPQRGDDAVILNGRIIRVVADNQARANDVTIEEGGTLDMNHYQSSEFTSLSGKGLLRITNTTNPLVLPVGDLTAFTGASGGTVEYYNFTTASTLPTTQTTYCNLLLSKTDANTRYVTLASNLTIYGNLDINNSNTSTAAANVLYLRIGNSSTARNLIVGKNLTIGTPSNTVVTASQIQVGSYANPDPHLDCPTASYHNQIYVRGNVYNYGTLLLTNKSLTATDAARYRTASTNGSAWLNFEGFDNSDFICNGPTNLERLIISKGSAASPDKSIMVTVSSNNSTYFQLYGQNNQGNSNFNMDSTYTSGGYLQRGYLFKALFIRRGTLKLNENINIESLTEGGQDFNILPNSCLWIDGAKVYTSKNSNGTGYTAATLYGTLRATRGFFDTRQSSGFVLGDAGTPIIWTEGVGTIATSQIWAAAGTAQSSYYQTGGTFNVRQNGENSHGNILMELVTNSSFTMTGGTLNFYLEGGSSYADNIRLDVLSTAYNVTGGTVNINLAGGRTCGLYTTAPFYNMNVTRTGAGTLNVNMQTPLTILKDLAVGADCNLNATASNMNLTLAGNFTISSNGTYVPSSNLTKFNGTSTQSLIFATGTNVTVAAASNTVNSGSVNGGFNNVEIANSSYVLTTADVTIKGDLLINDACAIDDNGKTVYVSGNVTNNGTHNSTGTGSMVLFGTASQTVGGNGQGYFGNLSINHNTGGTNTIQFTCDQSVTGNLRLLSTNTLNIQNYTLYLDSASLIYSDAATATTFSSTKMITTTGNKSDGGIKKYFYSGCKGMLFPLGVPTIYAGADFSVPNAAGWGNVVIRPVIGKHPLATTGCTGLDYYWVVDNQGVSKPTGITLKFYNTSIAAGQYGARYIPYKWTVNSSATAAGVVDFSNATPDATKENISGEYAVGQAACFGTILTFYSRQSGAWNDKNTWSNDSVHAATIATTFPTAVNPVVIGKVDSKHNFKDSVWVTTAAASGTLVVDYGSVLDVGTITGNNFGSIDSVKIGGTGKLKISSALATAEFPTGDFREFIGPNGGTVEYYTVGTVSFNIPQTAKVTAIRTYTLDTYNQLIIQPGASRTITTPPQNLTIYGKLVGIGSGTITHRCGSGMKTTVNDSIIINGPAFNMDMNEGQAITVMGALKIAAGSFNNKATTTRNILTLYGDLINNGTFDMRGTNALSRVLFTGYNDAFVRGSGATTKFDTIVVDKGIGMSSIVRAISSNFQLSQKEKSLVLKNGTFRLGCPSAEISISQATAYTIPSTACLSDSAGIINIGRNNGTFSTSNNVADLMLAGKLELLGVGLIRVGDTTKTYTNDIEIATAGTPEISISNSAVLSVSGQVRRNTTSTAGSLIYNQSGGKLTIKGISSVATRGQFEVCNPGSIFNASGGQIFISQGGGTTFGDLYLQPDLSSVSGGTINLNSVTMAASQAYKINAACTINNLTVQGVTGKTATANITVNPLVMNGTLLITSNATLLCNNFDVSLAGDFINRGTFTPGTNNVTFFGGNAQYLVPEVATTFYKLSMDKIAGNMILNPAASTINPYVSNTLYLLNGTFVDGGKILNVNGNIVNSATHNSVGSGYIYVAPATFGTQHISSPNNSGVFGNLTVENDLNVNVDDNITINGMLDIKKGVVYIDDNLLTLGVNAYVNGATTTRYIQSNGVLSDGGVTKLLSEYYTGDFKFEIGVFGKYTPARFTLNINNNATVGAINIKPINDKHPSLTLPTHTNYLNYYWSVTTTNLPGIEVSHEYNYKPSDAKGDPTKYVAGRFDSSTGNWIPSGGGEANTYVDYGTYQITFTDKSYLDGDYTAAESPEFGIVPHLYSKHNGNWEVPATWSTKSDLSDTYAGDASGGVQQGAKFHIMSGHTVTINNAGRIAYSTEIQSGGTLNVGKTISHNLGFVTGAGNLIVVNSDNLAYIFPGGNFDAFLAATGSTVVYDASNQIPASDPANTTGAPTANATLPVIEKYYNVIYQGGFAHYMSNVNFTVSGDLTIKDNNCTLNNASPNAFNRDITLIGNWIDNTGNAFVPGTGTVIFNGSGNQLIDNTTAGETFYNVTVNKSAGTLKYKNAITLNNNLYIQKGVLDNSQYLMPITIAGNWTNDIANGFIAGSGANCRVSFNGTVEQNINATYGEKFYNVTLNNAKHVFLHNFASIDGTDINFGAGGLVIGSCRLNLASTVGYSGTTRDKDHCIYTNGLASDTGIVKNFAATTFSNVVIPMGVYSVYKELTKYMPATFTSTNNAVVGSITTKPIGSIHPAANNGFTDELQVYWNVATTFINPTTDITATFECANSEVGGGAVNQTTWAIGRYSDPNWAPQYGILIPTATITMGASTTTCTFKTSTAGYDLNADFTAGEKTNFSTVYTYYSKTNGDWSVRSTWVVNGRTPATPPNGCPVVIKSGHTVKVYRDNIKISTISIIGKLDIGATKGHTFGSVSGTGYLYVKNQTDNTFKLPTANFSSFLGSAGGYMVFDGIGALPALATCKNIWLQGTGAKTLANNDLNVYGELRIIAGNLTNPNNRAITIQGDWIDGVANGYVPGTSTVTFNGSSTQNIRCSYGETYYNLAQTNFGTVNLYGGLVTVQNNMSVANGNFIANVGSQITVDADYNVSSGRLYLKSPTNSGAPASLITNGNVTGSNTTVERFVTRLEYHYMSTPITSASSLMFTNPVGLISPNNFNPNFYQYDETYDQPSDSPSWEDYGYAWQTGYNIDKSPRDMEIGRGYASYYNQYYTYPFTGEVNNTDVVVNVARDDNDSPDKDGWNLVGNPFPCAIDWALVPQANRLDVDNAVYFYEEILHDEDDISRVTTEKKYHYFINPISEAYPSYSTANRGEGYYGSLGVTVNANQNPSVIPAMQGFFVHAKNYGSITLPRSARVHSNLIFYKKRSGNEQTNATLPYQIVKLKTTNPVNGYNDEMAVWFDSKNTVAFDSEADAYKLSGGSDPLIGTLLNNSAVQLAINGLPSPDRNTVIPMTFSAKDAGSFTMEVSQMNLNDSLDVFLKDAVTGTLTSLRTNPAYAFDYAGGGLVSDRFSLVFSHLEQPVDTTGIDNVDKQESIVTIFANKGKVIVETNAKNFSNTRVEVYETTGRLMLSEKIQNGHSEFPVNSASGIYLVKYIDGKTSKVKKVFINK